MINYPPHVGIVSGKAIFILSIREKLGANLFHLWTYIKTMFIAQNHSKKYLGPYSSE